MKNQHAKRERDRRRRKIIVEQSKAQLEIENRRREDQLIGKLYKMSNQEKQLFYETWRVNQHKEIIKENRKLRNDEYNEREMRDFEFNILNDENFKEYHKIIFSAECKKEEIRAKELEKAYKQKKRSTNTHLCRDMVELMIDIVDVYK